MVKDKSVIVVGAGASKEFNLPIGSELLYKISDAFYKSERGYGISDEIVNSALNIYSSRFKVANPTYGYHKLIQTTQSIRKAIPLSISIDNLIDERKSDDVAVCAKIAIAKKILDAERDSTIYLNLSYNQSLNFENSRKTWLNQFFKILKQNCEFKNFHERLAQVKFVVFNYDRCIEHYMYYAIQSAYNVTEDEAKECMKSLDIYHPYGSVGSLPWMGESNPIGFGEDVRPDKLISLIDELKTFTEGIDKKESKISMIRKSIEKANTILFLGFGYHQLNLDLLYSNGIKHTNSGLTKYFGTTLGESDSNQSSIHSQLSKLAHISLDQIWLKDMSAFEIIGEYWRELSLSS